MTLSSACNTAAGLSAARPLEVRAGSRLRQSAAGAASPAKLRASSFQGTKLSSATISARRAPCSSSRIQAGLGDVAKYLSEAASSIFSVDNSDVPWSGTSSGFQGKVSHHEVARLRSLYNTVKATRERVSGCMDPSASNYNPNAIEDDGSCDFIPAEGVPLSEGLRDYISNSLSSLWGGNFKSQDEPDWSGTGFNYTGDIVSQRDITRLLTYEKVVQQTLEAAEKEAEKVEA